VDRALALRASGAVVVVIAHRSTATAKGATATEQFRRSVITDRIVTEWVDA
jgi:hypothetical protein